MEFIKIFAHSEWVWTKHSFLSSVPLLADWMNFEEINNNNCLKKRLKSSHTTDMDYSQVRLKLVHESVSLDIENRQLYTFSIWRHFL